MRESEARFRDYAETASDWYWETDTDHKFKRITDYERLLALGFEPFGLARWEYATDVRSEPEKWERHRSVLEARQPFRDFVYSASRTDGSLVYYKTSGKPIYDAKGAFLGYRGTGTDVTDLIRAQEALRASERSLRSAIDGIAGLVAIMAPDGELETVNRQVTEYFGRSPEELTNWATSDAVHPEDLPRVLDRFQRSVASGLAFNFELRMRRFDGEYRWFENRGAPIRDESGRIMRWYCLLVDIEDRTRALARLQQMQSDLAHTNRVSMIGELTASIAHEVNQPVAATVTNAQAALRWIDAEPPNLDEAQNALHRIIRHGSRAGAVVTRIRNLIKKAPPSDDRADINAAIREVIELTNSEALKNGVSVRTELVEGLLLVQGDRVELQQVVLNLMINAIEAMSGTRHEPRELIVSTDKTEAGGVLVSVRDSGPGLVAGVEENLFKSFHTTKPNGLGLGLSICRSIIESHGGRLWASANAPRGAVFQFTLPPHADDATLA